MIDRPDPLAQLDEYLSGAMSDELALAFEESLFAEAAAGGALELTYLDALANQSAWFVSRGGGYIKPITAEMVNQLRGLPRVHYLEIAADTRAEAWPEDTELVVYRVAIDLRGYQDIDVELVTPEGIHRKWFRDCPMDPSDGALYGLCEAPLAASAFRAEPLIGRVQASRDGKRQLVAEFRLTPA